jgi:hypothetical protein
MKRLIRVVAMLMILILAYEFDRWFEVARTSRPLGMLPLLWIDSAVTLVLAGILLALAWYVLIRGNGDKPISWIFLVIGFLMAFLQPLRFALASVFFLPRAFHHVMAGAGALTSQAGAFTAVIGVAGLLRRR